MQHTVPKLPGHHHQNNTYVWFGGYSGDEPQPINYGLPARKACPPGPRPPVGGGRSRMYALVRGRGKHTEQNLHPPQLPLQGWVDAATTATVATGSGVALLLPRGL